MSFINIGELMFWTLHLVRLLLYPSHYLLDHLLSLYTPTAEETQNGGIPVVKKWILSPTYVILLILNLPIVLFFFPIRCLLLISRDPYLMSVRFTPYNQSKKDGLKKGEATKSRFGLVTSNLCLLPEFMSRFNHLKDVGQRSRKIGERFVIDQFYEEDLKYDTKCTNLNSLSQNDSVKTNNKDCSNGNGNHGNNSGITVMGGVSTKFCNIDFVMIQEAWTTYYNRPLIQELHKVFPYIIHDAGVHSFSNNRFTLNSGLMIASRYPVTAVDFKPFVNYCKHGGLLSQGLLMVQVDLGNDKQQGRRIGYLLNTHLQSYQDDEVVIPSQLDEILQYSGEFVKKTSGRNDKVLFSFLGGDFNCDNMSPGDKESQEHKLFDLYEDIGRVRPGLDKDWAIGTEMRQRFMHEPMMSTPKGMKEVLLDPRHLRHYMIDADVQEHSISSLVDRDPPRDEHGNILESPVGGKRRIDLITIHKDYPVKVESYNFVTRLASLTDHVPVQLEFTC